MSENGAEPASEALEALAKTETAPDLASTSQMEQIESGELLTFTIFYIFRPKNKNFFWQFPIFIDNFNFFSR